MRVAVLRLRPFAPFAPAPAPLAGSGDLCAPAPLPGMVRGDRLWLAAPGVRSARADWDTRAERRRARFARPVYARAERDEGTEDDTALSLAWERLRAARAAHVAACQAARRAVPTGTPRPRRLVSLDAYLGLPGDAAADAVNVCAVAGEGCAPLPASESRITRRARESRGTRAAEATADAWLASHDAAHVGVRCDVAGWRPTAWLRPCGLRAGEAASYAAVMSATAGAEDMCAPLHGAREAELARREREEASDWALARVAGMLPGETWRDPATGVGFVLPVTRTVSPAQPAWGSAESEHAALVWAVSALDTPIAHVGDRVVKREERVAALVAARGYAMLRAAERRAEVLRANLRRVAAADAEHAARVARIPRDK